MMDQLENKEKLNSQFPQVRFEFDERRDVDKLNSFISRNVTRGGANFKEKIYYRNPELAGLDELDMADRLEKIKAYVHGRYERKREVLEDTQKKMSSEWKDYSPQFFGEVGRIFKGCDWPEGQYVGYLSISPPYPRYLDSKTFQLPFNSVDIGLKVVAHEMLHFIFYEYVRKRYLPDLPNTDEKEMNRRLENRFIRPLWDLSEVFNIVILRGEEWGKGNQDNTFSSYKDLIVYSSEFEKIWEQSGRNIDELFTRLEKRIEILDL